jgi:hypothetical protein
MKITVNSIEELEQLFNLFSLKSVNVEKTLETQIEEYKKVKPKEVKSRKTVEIEQPEIEQPQTEQPQTEQPEVEKPEIEQPEVEKPEIEQPEIEQTTPNKISVEALRDLQREVLREGESGRNFVRELLANYSCSSVTMLSEKHYQEYFNNLTSYISDNIKHP